MKNRGKFIKIVGISATVLGIVATLVTDWADEKKMDEKIDKKINEALSAKEDETES